MIVPVSPASYNSLTCYKPRKGQKGDGADGPVPCLVQESP